MSEAKKGNRVKVHYTGTLNDGTVFDTSKNREPLEFELGTGEMIPSFDAAVHGMSVGESRKVEIEATEAYGKRRDDLVISIPTDKIPDGLNPGKGDKLQINQQDGQSIPVTVTDVSNSEITLDANHELAGQDLNFDIELVEIN